jgi:hypothetical protein
MLKLTLQTGKTKKFLLFEVLFVTLALFFIELLAFFEKVKFWTRVYKEKVHDFFEINFMLKYNKAKSRNYFWLINQMPKPLLSRVIVH